MDSQPILSSSTVRKRYLLLSIHTTTDCTYICSCCYAHSLHNTWKAMNLLCVLQSQRQQIPCFPCDHACLFLESKQTDHSSVEVERELCLFVGFCVWHKATHILTKQQIYNLLINHDRYCGLLKQAEGEKQTKGVRNEGDHKGVMSVTQLWSQ